MNEKFFDLNREKQDRKDKNSICWYCHLICRNQRFPMKAMRNQSDFRHSQQRREIIEQLHQNLSDSKSQGRRVRSNILGSIKQMECRKRQVMNPALLKHQNLQNLFPCCNQGMLLHLTYPNQIHKTTSPSRLTILLQRRHRILFSLWKRKWQPILFSRNSPNPLFLPKPLPLHAMW